MVITTKDIFPEKNQGKKGEEVKEDSAQNDRRRTRRSDS